jgi:hypothetical protein
MSTPFDELAMLEEYLRRARAESIPYCPHTPTVKQQAFLRCNEREAMFGGAAGGGKSDALLMAALQHVDVPGYSALILRRTFADLSLPGAIMERSRTWLSQTDAHWNERDKVWTFPSGAKLQFGFCETPNDVYRYSGAEFQFIGIDELTQWEERTYRFLLSRLRRPKEGPLSKVPIRMRSATNPGGIGFEWVKNRFVDPGAPDRPFFPSKIDDNPHLDGEAYREALSLLDEATRDQLEKGLWIQDMTGRVYKFERPRNVIHRLPPRAKWESILGLDLGASEKVATTGFAHCLWHPNDAHVYVRKSYAKALLTPTDIAMEARKFLDEYPDTQIVVDYGGLGTGYLAEFERRWGLPVIKAEKKNKLGYRKLMNGAFERGELILLDGQNAQLEKELTTLVWDESGTDVAKSLADHISDALLYSYRRARAYAFEAEEQKPRHGTPEYWAAEADRLERADIERFERIEDVDRPDWERW